jgi:Uma2 family endonuclease
MALEFPAVPLSYDDYAAIDDGNRYQVFDGELVLTPSPSTRHQRIVLRIVRALDDYARTHGGEAFVAPLDVVLRAERPATVLQPDVLFVSLARQGIITDPNVQGPPDIVVEVLSSKMSRAHNTKKLALYAHYGVPELWVVPQDFDRVEVLRLLPDGRYDRPVLYLPEDTLESPLLPGFAVPVSSLFGA